MQLEHYMQLFTYLLVSENTSHEWACFDWSPYTPHCCFACLWWNTPAKVSSNHDTVSLPLLNHFHSPELAVCFVWVVYGHPSYRKPVLCFYSLVFMFSQLPGATGYKWISKKCMHNMQNVQNIVFLLFMQLEDVGFGTPWRSVGISASHLLLKFSNKLNFSNEL